MKITTWNVNGIRARLTHVVDFLREHEPDVLCLQETKVVDELFPVEALEDEERTITEQVQLPAEGLVANLPVRVCPQCYGVHRPSLRVCPYCQFKHPLDSRIPDEADIILKELEREKREMKRAVGRARTAEELEAIARERGYSMGWVDHVLRSRSIRRY